MATLENDSDEAGPGGDVPAVSRFVTARELAERLGVSTETVLRWTRDRKLPGFRMPGGALRYRESDLAVWLSERATDRPRTKARRATAAAGGTVGRNSSPKEAGGGDRAVHSTRSGVQTELW
jgi:excisionase family DNA binding protein